jgi:hypothetical protein
MMVVEHRHRQQPMLLVAAVVLVPLVVMLPVRDQREQGVLGCNHL